MISNSEMYQNLKKQYKKQTLYEIKQCQDLQNLIIQSLNEIEQKQILQRLNKCQREIKLLANYINSSKNNNSSSRKKRKQELTKYKKYLADKIEKQFKFSQFQQLKIRQLENQLQTSVDSRRNVGKESSLSINFLENKRQILKSTIKNKAEQFNKTIQSLMEENYRLTQLIKNEKKSCKSLSQQRNIRFIEQPLQNQAIHFDEYQTSSDYFPLNQTNNRQNVDQKQKDFAQNILKKCKSAQYFNQYQKIMQNLSPYPYYLGNRQTKQTTPRKKYINKLYAKKIKLNPELQQKYQQIKSNSQYFQTKSQKKIIRMPKTQTKGIAYRTYRTTQDKY